ncbi:LysR family glycine cleavage system transcriptional activator [Inquilinus ginsengisoli]|uniref:LysR family glycine cleavage system transcriptional activator n=1 Tax=Inquilinus ginsengisoli TaxID=363840 RepID=A0ABU1JYK5_9PROT|nr:LysR substrate-binding domain-containing protein [Inquilinus ginsengisoli]MDR6293694.1 LysR family glycine cleavage system transcriptional activator [Inquilinus ginsengisoli]
MRRLPPLAALRAFEAAARHLSFKRAAEELLVTPTAVSHQIRLLEETLGLRLFERRTRQVAMTDAAQRLYPVLRDGFDAFARTLDGLSAEARPRAVTLTATRAFTARRLVPRMASLQQRRPDIVLRLLAADEPVDLAAGTADLAIRYGSGLYPGLRSQPLGTDRMAPVAHPSLGLTAPEQLAGHRLVHFEWRVAHPDKPSWPRWFAAAGLLEPSAGALHCSDESHAIQAVAAGHGVGLLSLTLVAEELANGTLVQPFGPAIEGMGFHLLRRPGPESEPVAAVRDWVLAEFGQAADPAATQVSPPAASSG